jgi:hypothetical protein
VRNKWIPALLLVAALSALAPPVGAESNPLEAFKDLVGGRWRAQGTWANGQEFLQEIEFRWDLGQQIVIAESYGPVEQGSDELTHRNHGIRAWFPEKGKVWFWEFDVFGGLTQGEITFEGTRILMTYGYGDGDQKMKLRDTWARVDADTYEFTVQQLEDGEWGAALIQTRFKRIAAGE